MLSVPGGTTANATTKPVPITIYSNTVLASGSVLPQWQDTTNANTQSIVLSNDSISALIYEVAGVQEIVPANTLFITPIDPNTTFRVYGQATQPSLVTSPTYPQTVTIDYSANAVTGSSSTSIRPTNTSIVSASTLSSNFVGVTPIATATVTDMVAGVAGKQIVVDGYSIAMNQLGGTVAITPTNICTFRWVFDPAGAAIVFSQSTLDTSQPSVDVNYDQNPFVGPVGAKLSVSYAGINTGAPENYSIIIRYHFQ